MILEKFNEKFRCFCSSHIVCEKEEPNNKKTDSFKNRFF